MALAALIFAPVGVYTAQFVPVETLLILFAIAVLDAAVRMFFLCKES